MYLEEQRRRALSLLANLIIWVFEAVSFGVIWFGEYHNPLFFRGNYVVIGLYAIFLFLITKSFNGYKLSYMRVLDLCLSHGLAIVIGGAVAYIFICMVSRDYMNVLPVIIMVIIQIVFETLWVILIQHIYMLFFPPRKLIVIYGIYPPENFLLKINARRDRYQICEVLNYQQGMEKIQQDVLDFEGVVLYDLPSEDRNNILKYCFKHSIRTYVIPKITDIIMKGSDDMHLVDTPVFLSRNIGLQADQRFFKRATDLLISGVGIIVASPIMLIIAIIILTVLTLKFKMHPVMVLFLTATFCGLASGKTLVDTFSSITKYFGSTLGSIGVMIIFGAVIASGINDTGAATSMVNFFIKKFKGKCLELAPALTGFIMSIPVFGDIAIILNAPISAILAKRKKLGMQQVAPFVNLGLTLTQTKRTL